MPKPTIATRKAVHAAADALMEQGKKPTITDVRLIIGGGSETTIGNELRSWREAREEPGQSAEAVCVDAPQSLQDRVRELEARIDELRWVIINGSPMQSSGMRRSRLEELAAQIAEGDRQWLYLKEHHPHLADDPVQLQREQAAQRMQTLLEDLNRQVANATPQPGNPAPSSVLPAKWGVA